MAVEAATKNTRFSFRKWLCSSGISSGIVAAKSLSSWKLSQLNAVIMPGYVFRKVRHHHFELNEGFVVPNTQHFS